MEETLKNQDHPKKITSSATKASDNPPQEKTASGSGKKAADKGKMFSDKLKVQLQEKSRARRQHYGADSRVESAVSLRGRNDLQPELQLVHMPIEDLRSPLSRARVTTPAQLEGLIRSLRQFGQVLPVLIDGTGTVVSGHVIWEAAQKLGFKTIQCISIEHLNEAELKALSIALNRMAETGTWDLDLLREQMIAIDSAGIELTATGFCSFAIFPCLLDDNTEIRRPVARQRATEKTRQSAANSLFTTISELRVHSLNAAEMRGFEESILKYPESHRLGGGAD